MLHQIELGMSRPGTWGMPPSAVAGGSIFDRYMGLNLSIALGLLVLFNLLLFVGLLYKRRSNVLSPSAAAQFEYIPVILFTLLFTFFAFTAERLWAANRYVGAAPDALQVEVVGVQFAWYFRYPGKDAAFGRTRPTLIAPGEGNPLGLDPADEQGKDDFVTSELVLPVGREINLHLRAQDVIHGFSVPALRIKQNAVPGQALQLHFTPTDLGSYALLCTQVCGSGHYRMGATVRIVDEAAYAKWLQAETAVP